MPTRYEVYSRRRHGATRKRNVHTAYTYAALSHNNIAMPVYKSIIEDYVGNLYGCRYSITA
ncbi:hypothetical protein SAMN05421787_12122 [Virgibacillus pantothenticus]|nr:hypothetical protein SAMN05421787_12122 [Virgibacillus pantothenticus]